MSQQGNGQTNLSLSPPAPDGPPRTPWRIGGFVITVIPAYSWIFKTWDRSEFPETFAHPAYWLLLTSLLVLAGVWSVLVRNKRSRLDSVLAACLFIAAVGSLVASISVYRRARPSEKTFTVVLFTFTDHTANKNVGNSFRDNIQRELEARYHTEIVLLPRDREIKGEELEEKVSRARKWGSRWSGCHLAVWAELSMDKDGQNYVVNLYCIKVSPFGTQLNHEEVKSFDQDYQSFVARSVGGNAVEQDAINEVLPESLCCTARQITTRRSTIQHSEYCHL